MCKIDIERVEVVLFVTLRTRDLDMRSLASRVMPCGFGCLGGVECEKALDGMLTLLEGRGGERDVDGARARERVRRHGEIVRASVE